MAPADGTALYRIRGERAVPLYIGISDDFGERWKQHAKAQPWWSEMRSLHVDEWFAERADAEAAETTAIAAERPKYNIAKTEKARGKPRDIGPWYGIYKKGDPGWQEAYKAGLPVVLAAVGWRDSLRKPDGRSRPVTPRPPA